MTQARWLVGANADTAEIPAYSLVKVTSTDTEGRFSVQQPDTNGESVYVVGSLPIPAADENGDGIGAVTCDWPAWAKYESSDGTPAIGEIWGAGAGSWLLRKGQPGFLIVSDPDTTDEIVRVERVDHLLMGKLDGTLSFEGSATMSIWAYNGSAYADTTADITVYDWLLDTGDSIASGTQVVAAFVGGRWCVIGSGSATPPSGSATPPFAVLIGGGTPSSWTGREVNIASGTWSNSSHSGTTNARPVQIDGVTFTPKSGANVLLFADKDGDLGYLPVQAADRVSGTDYPGYVTPNAQTWNGNKTFGDGVYINDDTAISGVMFSVSFSYSGKKSLLSAGHTTYPYVQVGGGEPAQFYCYGEMHGTRIYIESGGLTNTPETAPGAIPTIGAASLAYPYDPTTYPATLALFGSSGAGVLLTPDNGKLGISSGVVAVTGEFTTSCTAYNYYTTEHSSPYGGYIGGTLGDGSGGYYFLNGLYIGGGSGGFGLPAGSQNGEIAYFNGTAWSVLSPPGSDGTYVLTATVSSGVLTLSWV